MALALGGNEFQHYKAAQAAGFAVPEVIALAERVRFEEWADGEAAFPAQFLARVRVTRRDGSVLERISYAPGTPDAPITPEAIRAKFHRLAGVVVDDSVATAIERGVDALADDASPRDFMKLLARPLSA
jgi:2-methylcitrate dehydratase PrpD